MRASHVWIVVLLVVLASAGWAEPQETATQSTAQGSHLVTFQGVLKDGEGNPRPGAATLVFRLYAAPEGGEPLWQETQVVQADAAGRYTVLLGATTATGLPTEAFGDGKAQWLGAQVEGETELPRALLVAVPYALKAADAETLGGKPIGSFVLTETLARAIEERVGTSAASEGPVSPTLGAATPLAGGGTGLGLIESSGSPYTTAIGYSALAVNTGSSNTAAGYMALNHNTSGMENIGLGYGSLYWNTTGYDNTAAGVNSMIGNTTGYYNAAVGASALFSNSVGYKNTAVGVSSLSGATTSHDNTALGFFAGMNATAGSYNIFLGSNVTGTASDTNTIRLGVPYSGGAGQNKTFIAGIRGVSVANALPVVVDASGQLGTADNSGNFGIGTAVPVARLQVEGGETRLSNGNGSYTHFNYANTGTNYVRGTTSFDSGPVYFTGGSVGIGTASPAARLHVEGGEMRLLNGSGSYTHLNYANTSTNYIRGTTYFDSAPVYFTGGNVGIGTTAPAYPLQLASGAHVTAGGVWTDASSRALKQGIAALPLGDALKAVGELAPVTYEYKASPGERHVGFIAEDVPELVATGDRKSLAPMDIVAVLTKVVQAQERRLQMQEQRYLAQQETIGEMKARLAELERLLAATVKQQ